MQILSFNFLIYTFAGIWWPVEWSSSGAKLLYNVLTSIVLFLEYFLLISQFMDIVLVIDNIDDFVTNSLMFASVIAVTCKATIIVTRRNAIIKLVQVLLTAPCKPRDGDEEMIQAKFDKFIRSCSIGYLLLAMGSVTGGIIRSWLNIIIHKQLPYRVWIPIWKTVDYNKVPLVFWIISIQQVTTVFFATIINIGTETMVFGLFLQTCAQLEIFENRLYKFVANKTTRYMECSFASPNGKNVMISEHIRHHLSIYKYAETLNVVFNQVLFVQFFCSIVTLCVTVFYLSKNISESGATILVYCICMFVQIYIYCWSGNEVMLKSMTVRDAIYHLDWPSISISDKKDLLMIMIRSTVPIKITSSFLVTVSLQSYSNILKMSYSTFNMLQQF